MRRLCAIVFAGLLFCVVFAARGGTQMPEHSDSLRSVYLYTEGIKQSQITGDTLKAHTFFLDAIRNDSTFAPAYYQLAMSDLYTDTPSAIERSGRAHRLDSTNMWYLQTYGQALIVGQRYDEALEVYRKLSRQGSKDPDHYRMLAALYDQAQQPFSAIAVLDTVEVRFGKIPSLSAMKRQLLVATRQYDKAVAEAKAMVDAVPYEAENHVVLGDLYASIGKDSLAGVEFQLAMAIDSTDIRTLMTLAEYYNRKQDFHGFLAITKRLFESEEVPIDSKVKRFGILTSDLRFYRNFYPQINDLAATLAIKYPNNRQVVELYAQHLIASGQLEQALSLYKLHLAERPPVKEYFKMVIDIESFRQQIDSVNMYVDQAIALFPDSPEFYISKGHAQSYAKQNGEAIKAYKRSLAYARTDSLKGLIWGYIGDTWQQEGLKTKNNRAKAMKMCYKAYDKSLKLFRDNPLVLNNYAYFLSEEGRSLEQALEMSSRAIALQSGNATYIDTYAWVLFKLGRMAEAKKSMMQAISLDTQKSPDLQVHYGDILSALGEKFMAEIYWRKALENGYDAEQINRRIEQQKSNKIPVVTP
ncbi:MAG: hypothetical protein RSA67_03975 [Alistipes sp.]